MRVFKKIFILLMIVSGCNYQSKIDNALEISKNIPDSSLSIIENIPISNLNPSELADYYLCLVEVSSELRLKNIIHIDSSKIKTILSSNPKHSIPFLLSYSKYLRKFGNDSLALIYLYKGVSLCINYNDNLINQFDAEISLLNKRKIVISSINKKIESIFKDKIDSISISIKEMLSKGIYYASIEETDSCKKYLVLALENALKNYNRDFAEYFINIHLPITPYTYNLLAYKDITRILYRKLNNFYSGPDSTLAIPNLKRSNSKKIVPGSPEFLLKKSSNYELDGNYPEALHYFEQYLLAKEQQRVSEVRKNIEEIEARYNNSLLQQENNRIKMRWYTIIGFSISVIFFGVMYYYNKIRHARKILTYNQQFNEKREQISIKALSSRLDMIRTIIKTSKKYQNHPELSTKIKEAIISDAVRNNFLENLDKEVDYNYDGIITRLKNRHPEINQDDIIFCSLIISGFSPRELSILYNYKNEQSLYVKSYRTAQKLGIDISLADYLDQLKTSHQ